MNLSRLTRRLAPAALVIAMLIATTASRPPAASPNDRAPSAGSARAIEAGWVRAHLDSVLTELPWRDVSALSTAKRARRSALLHWLRVYRDRGEFPRNYDFPGEAVPYFTDRKTGTLCAVGYLLESTGRRDIVERVTSANNNVRVRELAGDTALASWLDENGLALAEAARIQVVYAQAPGPSAAQVRHVAYIGLTPFALAGSVITGTWNALGNSDGHRLGTSIWGLTSGIASVGLGAALSGVQGIPKSSGLVMAGVGSLSTVLAVRAMLRHEHIVTAAREAERRNVTVDAAIVPAVAMGGGSGAGVAVSIRF